MTVFVVTAFYDIGHYRHVLGVATDMLKANDIKDRALSENPRWNRFEVVSLKLENG